MPPETRFLVKLERTTHGKLTYRHYLRCLQSSVIAMAVVLADFQQQADFALHFSALSYGLSPNFARNIKQINKLQSPLKSSENLRFSDEFV